jgi:flagellum-specific peptidoglycan hydrolase FlgJ
MTTYTHRVRDYRHQINSAFGFNAFESDVQETLPEIGGPRLSAEKKKRINNLAPAMMAACANSGIFPSVKMAQYILETGWGESSHAQPSINNYFGIKADPSWAGPVVSSTTHEVENGVKVKVVGTGKIYSSRAAALNDRADKSSLFRVYANPEDSIRDHTSFLKRHERYTKHGVFAAKNYAEQTAALKRAGYATSTTYDEKLNDLINTHRLYLLDGGNPVIYHGGGNNGNTTDEFTPDVKLVQQLLIANGYDLGRSGADGVYGPKTKAAVAAFLGKQGGYSNPVNNDKDNPSPIDNNGKPADYGELKAVYDALQRKGYKIFTNELELNIIGIRNSNDPNANTFNDTLLVSWMENGQWQSRKYAFTTDPGRTPRMNPDKYNSRGTGVAVLVEGQYINTYTIDKHRKEYDALTQRAGDVRVYRDNNRDGVIDFNPASIQKGSYGINIHKAGSDSNEVNNWSAGCQVFKRSADFYEFMQLAKRSQAAGYSKFTYTLINSNDLQ